MTDGLRAGRAYWRVGPALAAALSTALVAGAGCSLHSTPAVAEPDDIEMTVLFIGDAGEPDPRDPGAPLDSLYAHAAAAPGRTVILFLGDNIYPDGIPDPAAPDYPDAVRRLREQVRAVPHGARGIFVPGNHDWASSGPSGLYAIRRQEALITELAEGRDVRLLPENGCPGPVALDAGRVRLIMVDTHWWLHSYLVEDELSDCPTDVHTATDVLRQQVRPTMPGQIVIVTGHHPLMTGGKHGGYCGITAPFNRWAGSPQDILSSANRTMRDSLTAAFEENPPFIYAAGHDHNLQVLRGPPEARYLVVSGAGSYSKATCSVHMRESYFSAHNRIGFIRLDIMRGGGALLSVHHFDREGNGGLAWSRWLEEPGS
ncbi:MAG TPA: metallophosphoesterase [Longimicrobiales bacterium]|nr:metallophosphoesterase [Longimicrobiales bacterium]